MKDIESGIGDIRDIVNLAEWQSLRKSFIGTWKSSQVENVRKLRSFLGDNPNGRKVRIVLNYLTGSWFRINHWQLSPEVKLLLQEVRVKWESRKLHNSICGIG